MEIPADLADELNGSWKTKLLLTATHQPKPLLANALLALRDAPEWFGVLAYDEFSLCTMSMRPPPWFIARDNSWVPQRWEDCEDALACEWLQHRGIAVTVNVAATAVETVAKERAFHPIRDYLTGLVWDETPRLDTFTSTYFGSEDTSYHTAVGRCTLIAAVARIMQPGCKVDHVPILEGEQGILKSTSIDALFSPWFSDDLAELGSKDAAMQARVAWGIEIPELSSMSRGEIENTKAFITRRVDRFRPSYGRRVIEAPRQSVFIGTTNADSYLKDETGGRRFWPIRCGRIDIDALRQDRDQLWAEAVVRYKAGDAWWLTDDLDIAAANEHQEDRRLPEVWETVVAEFTNEKPSASIDEVLKDALFMDREKWNQGHRNSIARCFKALGWARYNARTKPRTWRYRPIGSSGSSMD